MIPGLYPETAHRDGEPCGCANCDKARAESMADARRSYRPVDLRSRMKAPKTVREFMERETADLKERRAIEKLTDEMRAEQDAPEAGEPGYRCPSCGNLYDSKMRTPADEICFECRHPEMERE